MGYIPFDPQAASLMFMLVSRRYERRSLIVTKWIVNGRVEPLAPQDGGEHPGCSFATVSNR